MKLRINAGAATLQCEVDGEGPLVICAHGFPDCENSFREMAPALVAGGLRVAVPTMRGYAPSSVASDRRYDARSLGRDLLAIADELSPHEPVAIVGHDWGAVAAYAAAALEPQRVRKLVTMAVPQLRIAARRWVRPNQLKRSWYMGLFQLPRIAERKLLANDLALVDRLWRDWSPGYRCPDDAMVRIKAAIAANPSAVLGYYRAMRRVDALFMKKTPVPTMYLHGVDDGCVGVEMVDGTEDGYSAGVEVHRIAGAGHFLHLEKPAHVNGLVVPYLQTP